MLLISPSEQDAASTQPTYANLVNAAVSILRRTINVGKYLFVLAPNREPLTDRFVDTLLASYLSIGEAGPSIRIVGCRTVLPPRSTTPTDSPASPREYLVLDRGFDVSLSYGDGKALKPDVVMIRTMNGFPANDLRTQESEPVLAVDPYCVLMRREVFLLPKDPNPATATKDGLEGGGLSSFVETTLQDQLQTGSYSADALNEACLCSDE